MVDPRRRRCSTSRRPRSRRRGAAAAAGRELAAWPDVPVGRPTCCAGTACCAAGRADGHGRAGAAGPRPAGDWLADPDRWAGTARAAHRGGGRARPRATRWPGLPVEAARAALGLPDRALVEALARRGQAPGAVRGPAGHRICGDRWPDRRRRCRRRWPRRCGPSWPTWRRRPSWRPRRGGCGNSAWTPGPSARPPGPACCCA